MIRAGVLLGALFLAGCATFVPPPVVRELPQAPPEDAWARVLAGYVDAQGRVDFAGLAKNRGDLDRYAAWIYAYGPANRPERYRTREQVLAYHINAYNALAMYNVIAAGMPIALATFGERYDFFYRRKLRVGGEEISLYDYENRVIRALGEERVHFALNCMAVSCPRLPRKPFSAATRYASAIVG